MLVAECSRSIVVSHGIAFDLVPDTHIGKEQLAVGKSAGAGIADTHLLADQVFDAFDARALANHQLSRSAVQPGNGHNIGVFFGVIFHLTVAAQPDVTGIDHAHLLSAGIGFSQIFNRTRRCLGLNGKIRTGFNRFINLDAVGNHLERSTSRSTTEYNSVFRIHASGKCQSQHADSD